VSHLSPVPFRRPEAELLCCCARTRWTPELKVRVQSLVDQELDWDAVQELAWRHRLRPLLLRTLRRMEIEGLPSEVTAQLHREWQGMMMLSLLRTRELVRMLDVLSEHGIEALAFKGPVLGQEAYGDIGLRPFGDLDVLLHRDDLPRVKDLLVAQGYRPNPAMGDVAERLYLDEQYAYSFVREDLGVEIELHWSLAHRTFAFRVDTAAVWRRARAIVLGGGRVHTLDLDDLLVFLCAHGAKHEWNQLIWITDIAEMLRRYPELSSQRVIERAKEAKAQQMLRLGVLLAHRLFQAPLSAPLLDFCRADAAIHRLSDQVIARALRKNERESRFAERLRFSAYAHDDWYGKGRNLLQNVRLAVSPSPKDRDFVSLPERWDFLYYLVRPFRVLRMRGDGKGAED
jgi:hypothetical protein